MTLTMNKFDDLTERLLFGFATRASGRTLMVVAVLLYGGVGLAVPLALGWSVAWLIAANVTGTMLAGVVVLVWLAVQVRASHRRHLVEWTTNLRLLDSEEFEWLVGELFRRDGWKVEEFGDVTDPTATSTSA